MTTIRDIIAAMRASQDWSTEEIDVIATLARRAERDGDHVRDRIAALEAENAALKAERDAYRSQFWDKALPDLVEMRKQRDAAYAERDAKHAAFNMMDDCYKQAVAERDSETRWAHYYFTAWQTARQSRARLVRLVRGLRAWFSETMPDSAYVKRITDERDAARAWAAAWRVSAHYWKAQQKFTGYAWAWTDGKIGGDEYFERTDKVRDWMYANVPAFVLERIDKRLSDNLRRDAGARRAAEAMERR